MSMITHKISELEGALLDAAVAKAGGARSEGVVWRWPAGGGLSKRAYAPSSNWGQGGPIIDRERISVVDADADPSPGYEWAANIARPDASFNSYGPTALVAAMRAYVASKFGEYVELP